MKLEFFPMTSAKSVFLIYDGTPAEVAALQEAFHELSKGSRQQVAIHLMPGMEPIEGCQLLAKRSSVNDGVNRLAEKASFEWLLTPERCREVAELLEGSKEPWKGGHAFLDPKSKISVIISAGRGW